MTFAKCTVSKCLRMSNTLLVLLPLLGSPHTRRVLRRVMDGGGPRKLRGGWSVGSAHGGWPWGCAMLRIEERGRGWPSRGWTQAHVTRWRGRASKTLGPGGRVESGGVRLVAGCPASDVEEVVCQLLGWRGEGSRETGNSWDCASVGLLSLSTLRFAPPKK